VDDDGENPRMGRGRGVVRGGRTRAVSEKRCVRVCVCVCQRTAVCV